jgi:hypothetical protein
VYYIQESDMQIVGEQHQIPYVRYRTLPAAVAESSLLLQRSGRTVALVACSLIWGYLFFLCLQVVGS